MGLGKERLQRLILTAITLLCFSFTANADIYFCQARHYAEANQNFTLTVNKEEFDNESRDSIYIEPISCTKF